MTCSSSSDLPLTTAPGQCEHWAGDLVSVSTSRPMLSRYCCLAFLSLQRAFWNQTWTTLFWRPMFWARLEHSTMLGLLLMLNTCFNIFTCTGVICVLHLFFGSDGETGDSYESISISSDPCSSSNS